MHPCEIKSILYTYNQLTSLKKNLSDSKLKTIEKTQNASCMLHVLFQHLLDIKELAS